MQAVAQDTIALHRCHKLSHYQDRLGKTERQPDTNNNNQPTQQPTLQQPLIPMSPLFGGSEAGEVEPPRSPMVGSVIQEEQRPPSPEPVPSPIPNTPSDQPVPIIYEGLDEQCSICASNFEHDDRVCRLSCRHMFHTQCWNRMFGYENAHGRGTLNCPNCRGAGSIIAAWRYIDEAMVAQRLHHTGQQVANLLTTNTQFHQIGTPLDGRMSPLASANTAREVPLIPPHQANGVIDEVFRDLKPVNHPLGPAPTPQGEPVAYGPPNGHMYVTWAYHIQTRLPDGRKSLLIDPGSVGNLCGDKWAKEMAQEEARNRRAPSYQQRQRPLKVGGVGNGTQVCAYDCTLPIAFRPTDERDGEPREGKINVPTVNNSDLPGLMGTNSLKEQSSDLRLEHTQAPFPWTWRLRFGKQLFLQDQAHTKARSHPLDIWLFLAASLDQRNLAKRTSWF